MTTFIFHGGGMNPVTGTNDTFYQELVKNIPERGIVLVVYFASREDDNSNRILYDTEKCQQFGKAHINVQVATPENFLQEVARADAIYLRGGSTEKLLTALRPYANLNSCFAGKTVAGSSAGAYALSTYFSSHYEDVAAEGLGIAPARVVTHYQSDSMPPRSAAIEALKQTALELPLIILKEGEWEVLEVTP